MTPPSAHKRATCPTCLRPQAACICHWARPIEHAVEVLVLQHPLEVRSAKGSARLLHLSLPHSLLVVGEAFDSQQLHQLLHAPFPGAQDAMPRQAVLLYPQTPEGVAPDAPQPASIDEDMLRSPSRLRLVVLDGTWRKSRKMLYLNPLLQALPRLSLTDAPPSQYRIRKAHRPDQLSTLEATCRALMQLEGDEQKFLPLLDAFDGFVRGFVDQQSAYISR